MKSLFVLVATLLVTLLHPAAACSEGLNVEVTPFAAYRFGGSFNVEDSSASYELDGSEAFGLLLNYRQTANTQWEVLYSLQNTRARLRDGSGTSPSVDADIHTLQLGGTYQGDGERLRPYLAMTLGGTHIRTVANGRQSDTFFSGSIGVGVNISPSSRLGFRFEARAYGTLSDSSTDLFCRTGPDANLCAIRVEGQLVSQVETIAGIVFRF